MGVRRNEHRSGREPLKEAAWDRKCPHPAPHTHIQFLLMLRGETRDGLWLSPDHVDGDQVLNL